MEISLNQYSLFLSSCVKSVVNIIIMFKIFKEAHKKTGLQALLKNYNGFVITRGK